ncbi:MAG TPA: DNA-3-methyladenine glycosylase 2 family protein [Aestuariivirgaceae bacterium]|jgi:DNA-3-methyladenine glycosylase II
MSIIRDRADLAHAIAQLAAREPRFARLARSGLPPLRRSPQGFATLAEIVVAQSISRRAAEAILARMRRAIVPLDEHEITRFDVHRLRQLGLTFAKARSIQAIAQETAARRFCFTSLGKLKDEEVLSRLTGLPGIGAWSANVYLLTALGRSDALPAGDIALQSAAQSLFELDVRPNGRAMQEMAEAWRPWRSVAARLLWMHYRNVKAARA